MNGAGSVQFLAAGTDMQIAITVVGEVGASELACCRYFASIPNRYVRRDIVFHKPAASRRCHRRHRRRDLPRLRPKRIRSTQSRWVSQNNPRG